MLQGGEDVFGVAHRQQGGIGVIGHAVSGGLDVGVELLVDLGQAVARAFGRSGLQIVQITRFFLKRMPIRATIFLTISAGQAKRY